jgi:cholesterol oxidase
LHVVRSIAPEGSGYRVTFDRITPAGLVRGDASAQRVFLAAGSLGSTELLLRARDEHRTLPQISPRLGKRWSANANVLSLADYRDGSRVRQSVGPTITAAIDFMDGVEVPERFVVQDDGFPDLLLNAFRAASHDAGADADGGLPADLKEAMSSRGTAHGIMLWLGAGVDAGDGELRLARQWRPPFRRTLDLRWNPDASRGVIEAIRATHAAMTAATGGKLRPDPGWQLLRNLVTLHPLGGCGIGTSAQSGVVDHLGQVFGYPGLHVVDGAIVPAPIGRNPSHTIAALAERVAAHVT